MMAGTKTITSLGLCCSLALAVSCSAKDNVCDFAIMFRKANERIQQTKRDPAEYDVDLVKRSNNVLYISMYQKFSPPYHRHFFFDTKTCALLKDQADQ